MQCRLGGGLEGRLEGQVGWQVPVGLSREWERAGLWSSKSEEQPRSTKLAEGDVTVAGMLFGYGEDLGRGGGDGTPYEKRGGAPPTGGTQAVRRTHRISIPAPSQKRHQCTPTARTRAGLNGIPPAKHYGMPITQWRLFIARSGRAGGLTRG